MPTATQSDPFAGPSQTPPDQSDPFVGLTKTSPEDFTDNTKGEGLYKMVGLDKQMKDVPYGRVLDASKAGWRIPNYERERYAEDRRTELLKTQPNISEPEYLRAMTLPTAIPEGPGWWSGVEGWVQKKTEPTTKWRDFKAPPVGPNPAMWESELNIAKRFGRGMFGVVDTIPQVVSAMKDSMSADPQKASEGEDRLLSMHPGAQVVDRAKEARDDYRRDPALAGENIAGDLLTIYATDRLAKLPGKVLRSEYLTRTKPYRLINQIIKPGVADLRFGKDPAGAILREGIVGSDARSIADQAYARLNEAGQEIDKTAKANANRPVPTQPIYDALRDAAEKAAEGKNVPLANRIIAMGEQLSYEYKMGLNPATGKIEPMPVRLVPNYVSPMEALTLKRQIGDLIRWSSDPLTGDMNKALGQAYGAAKETLNKVVPELEKPNEHYADLLGAAKAAEKQVPKEANSAHWKLTDIVIGTHHPAVAGGRMILREPAVRTRIARGLYNLPKHAPGVLAENAPTGLAVAGIGHRANRDGDKKEKKDATTGSGPSTKDTAPAPEGNDPFAGLADTSDQSPITSAAKKYGINPDLLRAVIENESGGQAGAVSVAGATGEMQLMPQTAKQYGVADATDPSQNVMAGAHYLSDLLAKHNGDTTEALKDYYGRGTPPPGHPSSDAYAKTVMDRFMEISKPPPAPTPAPMQTVKLETSGRKPSPARPNPKQPAQKYAALMRGPDGHEIGTNDGTTWFHVETGQRVN